MVRIALKDLDSSKASYWELWPCQLWASSCHQGCSKPVKNAKYATNVRIIYIKKKKATRHHCCLCDRIFPRAVSVFYLALAEVSSAGCSLTFGSNGIGEEFSSFFSSYKHDSCTPEQPAGLHYCLDTAVYLK